VADNALPPSKASPSERLAATPLSASQLILRMTRREIASYPDSTDDTVSHVFSKFQDGRLINVRSEGVDIREVANLKSRSFRGPAGNTGGCILLPASFGIHRRMAAKVLPCFYYFAFFVGKFRFMVFAVS
jgi:hypothetical protein